MKLFRIIIIGMIIMSLIAGCIDEVKPVPRADNYDNIVGPVEPDMDPTYFPIEETSIPIMTSNGI